MTHKEKILKHYKREKGLAQEFLAALRLLLGDYERKEISVLCPLCDAGACEDCPWHVLIHNNCGYMGTFMRRGRANRMKQIKRWIKAYEAAIKEL